MNVRDPYQPGELEGGTKRATDPNWYLKVSTLERAVTKPYEPLVYYFQDGRKRGFVCEGLLVCPAKYTASACLSHVKLNLLGVNPI